MHACVRLIFKGVVSLVNGLCHAVLATITRVAAAALRLVVRIICLYCGVIFFFLTLTAMLE